MYVFSFIAELVFKNHLCFLSHNPFRSTKGKGKGKAIPVTGRGDP
jgi:hypothetical protein